ncbi:hypothetical protein GIB67_016976 [Kingdonia uniflora]|uniref:Uncharacterized protein n=1 Tax=Kingdonia uniflora TaxID=39325 RepID=A0A7J7M3T8_9MAGN|nr:hypothetical protein GIB67_016976 [Kingdonia uniflora]
MDFSEDWKSLWSISSLFSPPLLLSGKSAKPLGPLLFSPSPKTLTPLFSSPSLYPPPPPPLSHNTNLHLLTQPKKDSFILPSVLSSIAADIFAPDDHTDVNSPPFQKNNLLQILDCNENNIFLLFFPVGENSDTVGFVKLSKKKSKTPVVIADTGGDVFRAKQSLNSRIIQISVMLYSGTSFLLASTLYSVDWYRVEIREELALVHLGTRHFSHVVVHSCWDSYLVESLVLLKNGDLFLFDIGCIAVTDKLPVKLVSRGKVARRVGG